MEERPDGLRVGQQRHGAALRRVVYDPLEVLEKLDQQPDPRVAKPVQTLVALVAPRTTRRRRLVGPGGGVAADLASQTLEGRLDGRERVLGLAEGRAQLVEDAVLGRLEAAPEEEEAPVGQGQLVHAAHRLVVRAVSSLVGVGRR